MEVPGLIRQARLLTSVTIGIPLAWVVYAWLACRRGWAVGLLGGAVLAFSPSVLAAASIATTDACFTLFAVLALAALRGYEARPTRGTFARAGVALGLALASKQSAVVLFPVALVELVWIASRGAPDGTRVDAVLRVGFVAGRRFAGLIALAFGVDWALYGFGLGPRYGSGSAHAYIPVIIPMIAGLFSGGEAFMDSLRNLKPPLAIDTFLGQLDHARAGHPAFLMGKYSFQGWWYFFPVALALKSTPAELVLFGSAAVQALRPRHWIDPTKRLWLGALAAMLGMGISSSINIGHRYMLLTYPLVVLIALDAFGVWALRRPRLAVLLGVCLLGWQASSACGIAPHYLSYFNSLCGGPFAGYRYLGDSSLDWGQDLPTLRRALEARRYRKVALGYFGTASADAYGLRWQEWQGPDDPLTSGCDWLAISTTTYQGIYSGSREIARHFGSLPSARAGYTFFLYDLNDPRVRSALDAIRRGVAPASSRE